MDDIAVDGFSIKAKLKGTYENLVELLQNISYFEVVKEKDKVEVAHVEARDINKKPYLFYIISFSEKEIKVEFSVPSNINPIRRKLDILKTFLNVLDLVSEYYEIKTSAVYNLIEDVVQRALDMTSEDHNKLYAKYEYLKKENEDLKKKIEALKESNEKLSKESYLLRSKYDDVLIKLRKLQEMSTEALKAKLQEWILEHNGGIDIVEFSNFYKVPEKRVEEALQQLVKEGYIIPKE